MSNDYQYHKSLTWKAEDLLGGLSLKDFVTSSDARLLGVKGMLVALIMLGVGGIMAYDPKRRGDPGPNAWSTDGVAMYYVPGGLNPADFAAYATAVA